MKLSRQLHEESPFGFATRLIVAIGLPLGIVVGVFVAIFIWRQMSSLGLQVDYFAKPGDTEPIASRTYRRVLAYHEEGTPARGVPRESYYAVWKGFLMVPSSASYTFDSMSDDGIRFFVDDLLLIDNWKNQGWKGSGKKTEVDLEAGSHPIRIEHVNRRGPSGLVLNWRGGEIAARTVVAVPYISKQPG
jgi:hypothetical protein